MDRNTVRRLVRRCTNCRASGRASSMLLITLLIGSGVEPVVSQVIQTITIDDALLSAQSHPAIRAARASVDAAIGAVSTARTFRFNPSLGASAGPARAANTSFTNVAFGISQTLELGGKRGARTRGADARAESATWQLQRTERLVAWRVERAFYRALITERRVTTAQEAQRIADALRDAATRRLELGAGTQLDLNLAFSGAARATRDRLDAERRYDSALLELTVAIGNDPTDLVAPVGAVPAVPALPTVDVLLSQASGRRSDFAALLAERRAADADVDLSRAGVWPDATLGVSLAREEDLRVGGLNVGISIPLWNRNQGVRATARANVARWEAVLDEAERELEREVRDAYQSFQRTSAAAAAFGQNIVERLAENLQLAQRSYESGKINLVEFSVVRRDLVDTQFAYLDTQSDLIDALVTLEAAIGGKLLTDTRGDG